MRTVLTKILTNQQTFKELCMGKCLTVSSAVYGVMIIKGWHTKYFLSVLGNSF